MATDGAKTRSLRLKWSIIGVGAVGWCCCRWVLAFRIIVKFRIIVDPVITYTLSISAVGKPHLPGVESVYLFLEFTIIGHSGPGGGALSVFGEKQVVSEFPTQPAKRGVVYSRPA